MTKSDPPSPFTPRQRRGLQALCDTFIGDTSAFPTAVGANPMWTWAILAAR